MSYRINIEIEEGSDADLNIKRLAVAAHLTDEVAALRLLSASDSAEESPADLLSRLRREKASRKAKGDKAPNGEAEKLIGLLADYPEIAESIRVFAQERRAKAYGSE